MAANPIPEGYHTATPFLFVKGAARAIRFYEKAFAHKDLGSLTYPNGKVGHAEIKIGNSIIMLADEYPEIRFRSPKSLGGSSTIIRLYVRNVDASFKKALAAGAKVLKPLKDQFYGDRAGTVTDPFGHVWIIATHKQDISEKEIGRRFKEAMKQEGGA